MTEITHGQPGRRRPPLAKATRRRLLAGLLERAEGGDVAAAEALIRLGMAAEGAAAKGSRREGRPPGE